MSDRLKTGYQMSHPNLGDEVVITGLAGYFPESSSVAEFQKNLFNKVDLVTGGRPWISSNVEIPDEMGKIKKLDKFEASFFGIDNKLAHHTGSMSRLLLERCYEAIIDAGMNPAEFRNTKTGVFIGSCFYESEKQLLYEKLNCNENAVIGSSHSGMGCQIAQWLGVTGPTHSVDTACSSATYALEHAFKAIRSGACDAAIVGGVNLCLYPFFTSLFMRMGVLSRQGKCKVFDDSANGYARSEAVVVCILQKAKDCRRAYAQIVYAKANCDGFKPKGISFPSANIQKCLLKEFYEECDIPASAVEYAEAHGTGTIAGDPEELNAIDDVMCEGRTGPLLIGSVKSNMGHSEAAAGVCSAVKLCMAYHSGYIPPNIHYNTPRKGVPALIEGRLKVVTEKQAWNRGLASLSGYAFGGANAHILFRNFEKQKINNGIPKDNLPRLVCVSGRTKSAVELILNSLEQRLLDIEEIRLWHAIHENNIEGHKFRGFVVLKPTPARTIPLARNVISYRNCDRPICVVYSNGFSELVNVKKLMDISTFASTIYKCDTALKDKNLNLIDIVTGNIPVYNSSLYLYISTVALQIALTDVIFRIGVKPGVFHGYGIGEVSCAYANGILTVKEAMNLAYFQGLHSTGKLESSENENINFKNFVKSENNGIHKVEREMNMAHTMECSLTANKIVPLIPRNALIIQVTQDSRFKNILKSHCNNVAEVNLVKEGTKNSKRDLFIGLGRLYEAGLNLKIARLYPDVSFPVSQGTPMLSHLVTWDHREDWYSIDFLSEHQNKSTAVERIVKISMNNPDFEYLNGHRVGGHLLYPGAGYLVLVWESFAIMHKRDYERFSVVFQNIRYHRATPILKNAEIVFNITIHPVSGEFEVTENMTTVVTGIIRPKKSIIQSFDQLPLSEHYNDPETVKLSQKDFYRELKLRGYDYEDAFKNVIDSKMDGSYGRVAWINNWTAYIDCVFQVSILRDDTKNLYISTGCAQLSIDTDLHYKELTKSNSVVNGSCIDVFTDDDTKTTRSGGLEIRGIRATMISKKADLSVPVAEKYVFFPNYGTDLVIFEDVIRIYVDIIVENTRAAKFVAIEIIDEGYKKKNDRYVLEYVNNVLEVNPQVRPELYIAKNKKNIYNKSESLEIPVHITRRNKLNKQTSAVFIVGDNLSQKNQILKETGVYLRDGGFFMSREKDTTYIMKLKDEFDIIAMHNSGDEFLVLFKKKVKVENKIFIKIDTFDQSFLWIAKLKEVIEEKNKVVLYAFDDVSGIIGLVNCLRKESGSDIIQCLFVTDPNKLSLDSEFEFYKKQLDKNIVFNIFKDSKWGTYRHIAIKKKDVIRPSPHAYLSIETVGDLSSLKWLEGSLNDNIEYKDENVLFVHVYSSALNVRDVMIATGRGTGDTIVRDRLEQQPMQGAEFCGKLPNGTRVVGIAEQSISNVVVCNKNLMIPIPDEWTFEEAASVMITYMTVYAAFDVYGKIKPGESILIHAGSGAVGQAAINVALRRGCEVFTTVGSAEKKDFLKKIYPQLKDTHIGNSRDTSFEQMIIKQTNGKGVDLVLNSLLEDKLLTSIRCLGHKGRFLEIGKHDIVQNSLIDISTHKKEISFHSVMIDYVFVNSSTGRNLVNLVTKGVIKGEVRPITYCTFIKEDVVAAYRYMAGSKHIGKVIIKIREEEGKFDKPKLMLIDAHRRYLCRKDYVYILVGGLGGFGLELADWLVLRGARKLVLVSSKGISTGYQASRVKIWLSYGVDIRILTEDVATESGCKIILELAVAMGHVEAIFNLAAILDDGIFQDQSPESFCKTFRPKALATSYLDNLSREMCPDLRDFVVFSSFSCGRGQSGQSNYGLANSVMERICEKRKEDGFPGTAIQWGVIGDVGLFAEIQAVTGITGIGGIVPQRIFSCLRDLDMLLMQSNAVMSMYVLAHKEVVENEQKSAVEAVAEIIGVKNLKTVSYQITLAELGMDSMMMLEVKQTLEKDFDIILTPQSLRNISFAELVSLVEKEKKGGSDCTGIVNPEKSHDENNLTFDLRYFISNFKEEQAVKPFIIKSSKPFKNIKKLDNTLVKPLFVIPGLEGNASSLEPLCRQLHTKTYVLHLPFDNTTSDLQDMTDKLYKLIKPMMKHTSSFNLLGYSIGTIPLLELAAKLESEGNIGTVFCIDGSPIWIKSMMKNVLSSKNDYEFQENIVKYLFETIVSDPSVITNLLKKATKLMRHDDKIDYIMEHTSLDLKYSNKFIKSIWKECNNCLKIVKNYNIDNIKKIKSPIVLIRSEYGTHCEFPENYGLDKFTESDVKVHFLKGNHITLLEDPNCALVIENYLKDN